MSDAGVFGDAHPWIAAALMIVGLWTLMCVAVVAVMCAWSAMAKQWGLRAQRAHDRAAVDRLIRGTRERNRFAILEPRGRG